MTSSQTVRERPKSTRPRPAAGTPPRSTRSTRSTRPAQGAAKPSSASSASIEETAKPSTRKPRTRAEAPPKPSAPRRMIRTEAVPQDEPTPVKTGRKATRNTAATDAPRAGKSTRNVIRTEPGEVTRTEIFTEKRTQAKYLAPAQFLLVMFGVVIVSVFAFGLLQGDTEQTLPEKPDPNEELRFEPNSTSTNTGILRGGGGE